MKENQRQIQILNPVGVPPREGRKPAPRIGSVMGSSVGFRVQWPSFDIFMARIGELLKERYDVKDVHYLYTGSDGTAAAKVSIRGRSDVQTWNKYYDDFAARTQWGIFGLCA